MTTTDTSQIEEVAQCVFETMLNMRLERQADSSFAPPDDVLATIQITGAFTGSVVLGLSGNVAKESAATMLSVSAAEVTEADERDVAAELVNMIGGNLKSLLPSPSYLSLPAVMDGRQAGFEIHGAELRDDVQLVTKSGPLRLRLYTPRRDVS
jgi:chemotaxis protein CheX